MAEQFRPEIVVLDLGMPTMNGYETCTRLRAQPWGESMVVVALTGWAQEGDRTRSTEAGFDFHLVKPVDTSELLAIMAAPQRGEH
jgi:DNA-binding response OmpR family regulator